MNLFKGQTERMHFAVLPRIPAIVNLERNSQMKNLNNKFRIMAASIVVATGMLAVSAPGFATEQAQQRREGRDVKQDTRQDARDTKQDCRADNQKSNANCRQDKRDTKQDGRQQARDIKY